MMETASLTSSCADFEDMIRQFRNRLRPPPALTLADWLRVNLGLSGATEDFDFPPRDEVRRRLRVVLRAVSQELETRRQNYAHLETPPAAA
jgi:hypothetical protein